MKTLKFFPIFLLLIGTVVLFQNCDKAMKFSSPSPGQEIIDGGGGENRLTCNVENHTQTPEVTTIGRKVDLLFVVDTSGSLDEERGFVADGISGFIESLDADVDYNVAVMLAHGSTATWSGKLFKKSADYLGGASEFVLKKEKGTDYISRELRYRTTGSGLPSDNVTDGGETGLFSLQRSITEQGKRDLIRQQGFYRDDALLTVIFVADENDICAIYPEGVTPVVDGQGSETSAYAPNCLKNGQVSVSQTTLVNTIRDFKNGTGGYSINGVMYTPALGPAGGGGENEIGYGYIEAINMSEGTAVDLRGGAVGISQGLEEIGQRVNTIIRFQKDFITNAPDEMESMKVWLDGVLLEQDVDFSWDDLTNTVRLINNFGHEDSNIKIEYCWWEEAAL